MIIELYNTLINSPFYAKILLGAFIIFLLIEVFFYLYFYTSIGIRNRKKRKSLNDKTNQPAVSVIICAKNEGVNLERFLPLVLEQKYPDYEVIVVNDGSCDDSMNILENFTKKYPHLYTTSIPRDSRTISHKKLALTVGIKAAKNDILLFTDADCRPLSPHWISEMVSNFSDETEFVIGYGGYYRNKGILSTIISYDTIFIAMQYFGFAYRGIPYMGVGRNIAYKKSTFFRVKGFAGFLHIASGDDDLLINSFSNKKNTRIESTAISKTLSIPETTFGDWIHQKKRHLSTTKVYTQKSKFFLSIEPTSRGAMYLMLLLLFFVNPLPIQAIICASTLLFAKYIIQLFTINSVAKQLKERKYHINIIVLDIILPVITLYLLIVQKLLSSVKKKNRYKW